MDGGHVKKILYLICIVCLLGGCAKIKHLDQLLLIKGLSDEQIAIDAYIEEQEGYFDQLLTEINEGSFDAYQTKKQIVKSFGEPISIDTLNDNGPAVELWLYRPPTEYFDTKKVYMYFNQEGRIVDWNYQKDGVLCLGRKVAAEKGVLKLMCPLQKEDLSAEEIK